MRATILGIQVEGTPQEIAELIKLAGPAPDVPQPSLDNLLYHQQFDKPWTPMKPWWGPTITFDTTTAESSEQDDGKSLWQTVTCYTDADKHGITLTA